MQCWSCRGSAGGVEAVLEVYPCCLVLEVVAGRHVAARAYLWPGAAAVRHRISRGRRVRLPQIASRAPPARAPPRPGALNASREAGAGWRAGRMPRPAGSRSAALISPSASRDRLQGRIQICCEPRSAAGRSRRTATARTWSRSRRTRTWSGQVAAPPVRSPLPCPPPPRPGPPQAPVGFLVRTDWPGPWTLPLAHNPYAHG